MGQILAARNSRISERIGESIRALLLLREEKGIQFIASVSQSIVTAFRSSNKVLIAGNGGSLCDAAHFAEELTGFFHEKRPALPCIVLNDPAHISCVANDIGYEWVFARGIQAYAQPGDLFIGLSTSGNSANIIHAFETAKERGLTTVALLGKDGGKIKGMCDHELIISGFPRSDRIQEAHMTALHIIVELVEASLFTE